MHDVENIRLTDNAAGALLRVKAVGGSSRDRIVGVLGDSLKVAVSASPERGKANKAIAAILAKALGLPGGDVTLAIGGSRPHKQFAISGMSSEAIRRRLRAI